MPERLQKILAAAGLASRRSCEQWIRDGRVTVDGQVITELGTRADPGVQKIAVDGRPISRVSSRRHYIALHKPAGITTTLSDPHAKKRVSDLVDLPGNPLLRPVGRLDTASEGLLFLSDDGAFIHHLTHPRYHVPKTYLATVTATPTADSLRRLAEGIALEDGRTAPAERVRLVKEFPSTNTSDVELTIHEGKKRQVRRMMDAIGHPVQRLMRTRIGSVTLGSLPAGAWRHLTPTEVARLMSNSDQKEPPAAPTSRRPERNHKSNKGSFSNGKPKLHDPDKQGNDQGSARQRSRAHHSR